MERKQLYMSYHENTLMRIRNVCEITQQHYEPGRKDRCYKEIWRRYVYPIYPCCYRTYLTYIGINVEKELKSIAEKKNAGQLTLF